MKENENINKNNKIANMKENKKYSKKEKAQFRLVAFEGQAKEIQEKLDIFLGLFKDILKKDESIKKRAMVKNVPNRIEFEYIGLDFYIDFTLLSFNGDDLTDIRGSIIYGVNRTLCFAECINPVTNKKTKHKICDLIARCDKFEDKPLFQFSVNRHGLIKSSGKLEDEWWVNEDESKNEESLAELHYRTLCEIWTEALAWTNETILP